MNVNLCRFEHHISLSVIYRDGELEIEVQIDPKQETIWLNREHLSQLFGRDIETIGKHINNALKEEAELWTVAKFATVQIEGTREVIRMVEHYNLDKIISAGYRVKSKQDINFCTSHGSFTRPCKVRTYLYKCLITDLSSPYKQHTYLLPIISFVNISVSSQIWMRI